MPATKSTTSLAPVDGTEQRSSSTTAMNTSSSSTAKTNTSLPYIVIPGLKRPMSRKVATNKHNGMRALVIPDKRTGKSTLLKVSLMRERRVLFHTLHGHQSDIVDLEFLQTKSDTPPIYVLGSCDRDGVVFLWFLYVAIDKLNIEINLQLLKKYSFFTLRRSTTAFYTRIRLAGSVQQGTMVLVPNDGASVRVVSFHCQTTLNTTTDVPLITVDDGAANNNSHGGDNSVGGDTSNNNSNIHEDNQNSKHLLTMHENIIDDDDDDDDVHDDLDDHGNSFTHQRDAQGLEDIRQKRQNKNHSHSQEEQGVSSRSTLNSSLAQARADANIMDDDDDVDDDDEEEDENLSISQMEDALDPITKQQQQRGIRQVVHVDVVRENISDDDDQQQDDDYDPEIDDNLELDDDQYQQQQQQQHHHHQHQQEQEQEQEQEHQQSRQQHNSAAIGSAPTPTQMTDALIVEGEGLTGYNVLQ